VLDWELAHLGDPCRDIGWACINSWRFGQIARPALGLASLEHFLAAYQRAGGTAFPPARLRFWQIFGSLNWGLICLEMARMWRDGEDRTLERLVIGRRVSEAEADLLLLLEEDAPRAAVPAPFAPEMPPARGEPGAAELLQAVAEWLRAEVRPALPDRARFMASVALHALGIVEREWQRQPEMPDAMLAARLLAGELNISSPGVLAALRRSSWARLEVDQPNYSALVRMRAEWDEKHAV
jgi:hypothetical protein